MCAACNGEFEPKDGTVNVVRLRWDEPGAVICPECVNRLGSRGLITKDPEDEQFKCRCDSLEHERCPVHDSTNLVQPIHIS